MNQKKKFSDTYIVLQGWMLELDLPSAREERAFALIYGFCQDGESEFTGSINYLSKWLRCSRPTTIKTMDNLVKEGLLVKRQDNINNVVFNRYKVNFEEVSRRRNGFTSSKETLRGVVKNVDQGSKENLRGGSKETLPNNTNLYNTIDKHKNISLSEKENFTQNEKEVKTENVEAAKEKEKSCAKKENAPKLSPTEMKVQDALKKAKKHFEDWPDDKRIYLERAKIKEDDEGFNFDDQLEQWIRHFSDNLMLLQNPERHLAKSFQTWLMRFHQFKPKAITKPAYNDRKGNSETGIDARQAGLRRLLERRGLIRDASDT